MKVSKCMVSFLLIAVFLVGCAQEQLPKGMPDLVSYEVVITQEGKPLEGAYVVLKSDSHGYLVDGVTGSGGSLKLKTSGKYSGVPAGEYVVAVKKEIADQSQYGNEAPVGEEEMAKWEANRAKEKLAVHSYVEKKYGNVKTSGLKLSITQAGKSTLEVGKAVDDVRTISGNAR